MGLLGFLSRDKILNENRSKPFYDNKSNDERKDWFSRTKPWHKVHSRIVDAIVSKFGNNPMFEAFVIVSMQENLVSKYIDINSSNILEDNDIICSTISGILCVTGSYATNMLINVINNKNGLEKAQEHYRTVRMAFESAIILESRQVVAYYGLAFVCKLINKSDEAIKYAQDGIAVIHDIRDQNIPFHLSKIDYVENADRDMKNMESNLNSIITDL